MLRSDFFKFMKSTRWWSGTIKFSFSIVNRYRKHLRMREKVKDKNLVQFWFWPDFTILIQNKNFTISSRWSLRATEFFICMMKRSRKHFWFIEKFKDEKNTIQAVLAKNNVEERFF